MSDDKSKTSWLARRNDFPWLSERDKLIARKRKNECGDFELEDSRKIPARTPVGELLKFAKVARQQPEIWAAINAIVDRYRNDPNTDLTKDEIHFFNFFRQWYVLKNNLAYSPSTFMAVDGLLLRLARNEITDLDGREARELLLQDPFVTD